MNNERIARVVLLANSQGTSAGIHWKEAYPAVLAELLGENIELHRLLMSGWTIRDFLGVIEDNVIGLHPDLIVIQIGVVECARRVLSAKQKAIFRILPFGRKITRYLHINRAIVLKIRNWLGINTRLVELLEFEILISKAVKIFEEHHVPYLFVPIPLLPDNGASLKHPMINNDIEEYNRILIKHDNFPVNSELNQLRNLMFQLESVHFTVGGHKSIAEYLARLIVAKLSSCFTPWSKIAK